MHAGKAAWLGQRRVRTQCKGKAAKFCKVTLALIIRIVTRTGLHIGRKKKDAPLGRAAVLPCGPSGAGRRHGLYQCTLYLGY